MDLSSIFIRNRKEVSVIFDIGSSSIGATLVILSTNSKPHIVYTARERLAFQQKMSAMRLISLKKNALEKVTDSLLNAGLSHLKRVSKDQYKIDRVHCVFSSPWYISKTKMLHAEQDEPFTVTSELTRSLINQSQKEFSTTLQKSNDDGETSQPVSIIEKKIIEARLNEYNVDDIYFKKTKKFDATLYMSAIPVPILDRINDIIHRSLGVRKIEFHSFPVVYFSAVRDILHIQDFVFLDVTGEVTDVSIVKNGVLLETVSFPFGKHSLIRRAVEVLNSPPEVAASFLKLYLKDENRKDKTGKLSEMLAEASKEWSTSLRDALALLSEDVLLPQTIFVAVAEDMASFFTDGLSKEPYQELGVKGESYKIILLSAEKLKDFCEWSRDAVPPDPFLALEAIFLNKVINWKS